MNTKCFLLLFALSITTPSASLISKAVSNAKTTKLETQIGIVEDVLHQTQQVTYPGKLQTNPDDHATKAPKQPEDGKHHQFHFTRIISIRRRKVAVIVSKAIITIMHICLFIYCFMHVFH